jgi:hypothetical protein
VSHFALPLSPAAQGQQGVAAAWNVGEQKHTQFQGAGSAAAAAAHRALMVPGSSSAPAPHTTMMNPLMEVGVTIEYEV